MKTTQLIAGLFAMAAPLATNAAIAASYDDEIVVSGNLEEERKEAQRFVADVALPAGDQLARFHDPVCPQVIGLPEDRARAIRERVIQVAVAAGLKADQPGCRGNLVVIATDDAPAFFREIEETRPHWLEGVTPVVRDKLRKAKGPVLSWASTTLRNEDGTRVESAGDPNAQQTLKVRRASILGLPRKQHLDGTVILIEREALVDRSLLQLADFVAMQGLAMVEPPRNSNLGTVLSAFSKSGGEAPESLTAADFAFLKALYAGKGTTRDVLERARIADAIAKFDTSGED